LQVFLSRPVFVNIRNDTTIKNNLAAFVQCFDTGTAPAVGYTRTVTVGNVNSAAISNDWSLLESQAALTNVDLIVKGTLNGQRHGLVFQPLAGTYRPDSTTLTVLTLAQLIAKIQSGDTLTLMGVPPGSGVRMGIDRDVDGVLDGDVPLPSLQIGQATGAAVLHWPYSAVGFSLQGTALLSPAAWTGVTDPWEIVGNENFVTNAPASGLSFYRLAR
jgi:hypothetical protein